VMVIRRTPSSISAVSSVSMSSSIFSTESAVGERLLEEPPTSRYLPPFRPVSRVCCPR
jgi:hypothetical protein